MKKDLKSFMKSKGTDANPQSIDPDLKHNIEQKAAKYQGKSEDELMRELSKEIAKGRQDGSFTEESANTFIKTVSPMLNSAQKKKLNAIMNQVKGSK